MLIIIYKQFTACAIEIIIISAKFWSHFIYRINFLYKSAIFKN